jgi:hypothetical protein
MGGGVGGRGGRVCQFPRVILEPTERISVKIGVRYLQKKNLPIPMV